MEKTEKPHNATSIKYIEYEVLNPEYVQINGNYSVRAVIESTIVCHTEYYKSVLTGGQDVLCNANDKDFKFPVASGKQILQVDEDFEVSYSIKDVLTHSASVAVTDVQSGVGTVILDGNVFLSLTALQNNEKNDIVKEAKVIPFRLEVAVSDATPAMQAFGRASVCRSAFKIVVDEEKHSSTVVCSFDLDSYACAYDIKPLRFVEDAYSTKNKVSAGICTADEKHIVNQFCLSDKIIGATDFTPDMGCEPIAVVDGKVESVSIAPDGNSVVGIASATVICKNADGEVISGRASLPFETAFTARKDAEYRLSSAIEYLNYRVRASVELEVSVRICVMEIERISHTFVTDLMIGDELEEKTNAISIYLARPDDTLWSVCKALGASAELITELNPDVQFPLSGKERILIYRNI